MKLFSRSNSGVGVSAGVNQLDDISTRSASKKLARRGSGSSVSTAATSLSLDSDRTSAALHSNRSSSPPPCCVVRTVPACIVEKRVHFDLLDNNNSTHSTKSTKSTNKKSKSKTSSSASSASKVHTYKAIPQMYREELFWTKDEIASIKTENRRLAEAAAEAHPELLESILVLHGLTHNPDQPDVPFTIDKELAIQILRDSECRGLEHYIAPILFRNRSWAMGKVLFYQEACKQQGADPEQSSMLIKTLTAQISKASSDYSRNLALCDVEMDSNLLCI